MANLIFDYDGTIHESMKTYAPAFRNTCKWLSDNGYISSKKYTDKEISHWLGFNSKDMWNAFQPNLSTEIREKARIMLGEEMGKRIVNKEGSLFLHADEVLTELKNQGHNLIFLSNCRVNYMKIHTEVFELKKYFDFFYCCEEYDFIPKYQIFRLFSPMHSGQYIAIGDRFHDIEIAVQNGLKSIGCEYGYAENGELDKANIIVKDITDIPEAVKQLIV